MPRRIKSHHNYETNHKKQIENMTTIIEHLMKRIRYLEDNIKALQRAELGIEVKYDYHEDREGVQRNHVIHHQADKLLAEKIKLAQTQTELNDFIIEKWKDQEKKNISKNPGDFIE